MITSDMRYHDPDHIFERNFWGDCCNTLGEEIKQMEYAMRMGLQPHNFRIDAHNKNILDIGGGPVSLLLKCYNLGMKCIVADPIQYPHWVYDRYAVHNIRYSDMAGEDIDAENGFDEVWIYNVLQHCVDPAKIIANAKRAAPVLRIFEWLDFPPHPGHPHMLTKEALDEWIGGKGSTEYLGGNGCFGKSYFGVFKHG